MRDLPSGTVTFLFTDVEGSTKLLHELGAEAYADALAEHRRVLREAFGAQGGVEVDTQGDAFFVAFSTAPGALQAAAEALEGLERGPIRVRMGIHTGTPHRAEEGYVGHDVHRAARIAACGHGGQVLVSAATASLLQTDRLHDLGEHRLKDLSAPERIYQLGGEEFPPLKSLHQTNLPVPTTPFLGREKELAEVLALLLRDDIRLLTLTGTGGTGKTRLALQASAGAAEHYPQGVWWISLAPLREPELVLEAAVQALGVKEDLAEHIGHKRLLLFFDNFEHVVEAATDVAGLLASCPNLQLLVTSRESLHVAGEQEYPVPPLAPEEGVDFFLARARAVKPDFEADVAVPEICDRLDGLPLAIELAAARTRSLTPKKLLERLERRLPLLTGGRRDAPERQRTLRATIEWSYDLLSAEARQLFAGLAVFAGGFDLEAAENVCDADLDTLEALLEQSMLRRTEEGRFFYLETIREFALEKLEQSVEAEGIRRLHAEQFLALAESAGLTLEGEGEMRHELVIRDQDNVRVALEWTLESNEVELGLQLAGALENFWVTSSPAEGKRWLSELLERGGEVPSQVRARARRALGSVTDISGELDDAMPHYEASLAEYRRLGYDPGIANILHRLASKALSRGDTEQARSLGEESLRLWQKSGLKKGEAVALGILADLERTVGNDALALELLERSDALADTSGSTWWRAYVLLQLSDLLRAQGRLPESEARIREALSLTTRMRDRQRTIHALAMLARLAAETGRPERAGWLWGAVEADVARAPVGQWEQLRDEYAELVLADPGLEFERGRDNGSHLSLWEAVEHILEIEAEGA